MKVVVFSTHITWPYHYETELEIMQTHLDQGHEVIQLVCNASYGICDTNMEHNPFKCMFCISRRKAGVSMLQGKVKVKEILDYAGEKERHESMNLPVSFESLDHLQTLQLGNFPIGYAVGSTLVSLLRDTSLDFVANKGKLSQLLKHAALTYLTCKKFLQEEKPDLVYVFNGRFPNPRAMLSACLEAGITCNTHERGFNYAHYELFPDHLPHDWNFRRKMVEEAWEKAEEPKRSELGHAFFTDRKKGKEQGWHSYVKNQKTGAMPEGWNPNLHNIVIFNSSEDEFISLGDDWKNKLYPSQYNAIRRICRDLKDHPDVRVYLRCHPNLAGASEQEKRELESMKLEHLVYIAPDDPISTYTLVDNASVVMTFLSTVGIEAAYWGKPSVLAGPSLFAELGSTYNPQSHEEVIELLLNKNLPAKSNMGALIYGHYLNSFGRKFKYFEPESLAGGKFKGKDLMNPSLAYRLPKFILDKDPTALTTRILNRYYKGRIKGFDA